MQMKVYSQLILSKKYNVLVKILKFKITWLKMPTMCPIGVRYFQQQKNWFSSSNTNKNSSSNDF